MIPEHQHETKFRMDRLKVEKILDIFSDGRVLDIDPNKVLRIDIAEGVATIVTSEFIQ